MLRRVALPPRAGDAAGAGTVVLLHGFGADETDLLGLAPALPPGLGYVSLRAPLPLPWGGYAWYPLRSLPGGPSTPAPGPQHGQGAGEGEGVEAAVQAVRAWLAAAVGRGEVEPSRTALLGFSQGAAVAAALATDGRVPPLAGYVLLSGFWPARPAAAAVPGAPVFVGHGSEDPLVPVRLGQELAERLSAAGAAVTFRTYAVGHAVAGEELGDVARWLSAVLAGGRR